MKKKYSTGSNWEKEYSYSRLVVVDDRAYMAGTASVDEKGNVIGIGDPSEQTRYILNKIEKYIEKAGFKRDDVVRTRMYVINPEDAEAVVKIHGEFFKGIDPAATLVLIKGLLTPEMLVEIEAEIHRAK